MVDLWKEVGEEMKKEEEDSKTHVAFMKSINLRFEF
jgi:hypothetical protein